MFFPSSIQKLIDCFSKLPTVGHKTAERYAFFLLKQDSVWLQQFAQSISELKEKTTVCQTCMAISETNPCLICINNQRNKEQLCVIADFRDMLVLEATKQYHGLYFVLGGLINTIETIGPEQLNIKQLINYLKNKQIKEIIIALSPNLEGETTILYLAKLLKQLNLEQIKITRLVRGLSSGTELEYADEITLSNALKYRNELL
ncbi:recombination mediator RecR [Patescibacteria group bacterium]|nr:recombination mediator RecR [Patescibacteria group bacterium]MBU0879417.1 recombination mediator RecR [Patescibacteria group bacterium]MBU0879933.1 recombination mediator RecR [Patescibacteria group bacterium]MBU0897553.1 recombination mediator RecR [Patescibacteria group bacterium]MBU1062752.1 recombination mediator RecR [Patescibacteria group bacterium]